MTVIILSKQCKNCKHYLISGGWKDYKPYCKAFPDGIPESIQSEKRDHSYPYHGDKGIRYKSIDEND